jgi:sarcosine oxidase subunit gamma
MSTARIQTTSPVGNRNPIEARNSLEELAWCGKIILRGDVGTRRFTRQCEKILGLALPLKANTCSTSNNTVNDNSTNDNSTYYWLGPDEWLLHCPLQDLDTRMAALKSALSGCHHAIVDVSDYYTMLNLDGPDASTLLAKACPLDLHPDVFAVGDCTQTRFGHASVLIHKLTDNPTYTIQVRWSFTEYLWEYLTSGMRALP